MMPKQAGEIIRSQCGFLWLILTLSNIILHTASSELFWFLAILISIWFSQLKMTLYNLAKINYFLMVVIYRSNSELTC